MDPLPGSAVEPQEQALRALLEAVSDGVAVCRDDGRIAWANPALAALAGRETPEKLLGRPFAELFVEPDLELAREDFQGPLEAHLEAAESRRRVLVDRVPGAELLTFRVRDLSELAERGAEVQRMARALQRANRESAELRERLRRDVAERDELLNMVSHELRTPVTVISGYNRLLLAGKVGALSAEQERFVRECQKSCQRLNQFVGNLLEKARGLVGQGVLELHPEPVGPMVEAVVGFLSPLLRERGLAVHLDLPAQLAPAWLDRPRVEQVVTNLLDNAIKHAPEASRIEVEARPVQEGGRGWVEIAVMDRGPGVREEERERIFEAYVQGGGRRGAGGLGLGLAICRRIVAAHGGRIGVAPRADGGSRFAFTLPLDPPERTA